MERKNSNKPVQRVVRTGKPVKKRRKKPLTKGQRVAKTIFATIGKVLLTSFLVMVITGCIVGTALTIYVLQYVDSEPVIQLSEVEMSNSGTIFGINAQGDYEVVQQISRGAKREWVSLSQIPQDLQDAFVYFEDERFYSHEGVDFKRTFGAVLNEILNLFHIGSGGDRFGGSTITQQLVKNINGDIYNRTVEVKIKEIMQAMNLERNYSKDQILEAYLNIAGLHFNTIGVQAGANLYFGKDVSELTLAECASLAVITKSPKNYNPISNPEANKTRRDNCLKKMLEFDRITQEEYEEAINTPVVTVDQSNTESEEEQETTTNKQSWFVDAVIEDVIDDLVEQYDYTEEYAEEKLYTGGWKVYSTMEIQTQQRMEAIFENNDNFKASPYNSETMPQASMVIMDYEGNVRGLIGGRGEKDQARGFNRATMAYRGFGSTIKPLSAYTPALEQNLITWSTVMMDEPVMEITDPKTGEKRQWPSNYSKKYNGPVSIIDAVRNSLNTIPVQLVQSLGVDTSYDFMKNELGFSKLVKDASQIGEDSMALGSAATNLVELTAAYQIFGNGGYYVEPTTYTKVVDMSGKVILDNTNREKKQVISTDTATVMNRMLWEAVNNGGTGARAASSKWEVVGKSGTSNDYIDLAFAGCTPYYVASIRYGFDDNSAISNKMGRHDISLWKTVMESVQQDLPSKKFDLNMTGVVQERYCTETGLLAGSDCTSTKTGYFRESNIPAVCTGHGSAQSTSDSEQSTVSAIQ